AEPAGPTATGAAAATAAAPPRSSGSGSRRRRRSKPAPSGPATAVAVPEEDSAMIDEVSPEEQGEQARSFVEGLVDAVGVDATVTSRLVDEDTIEIAVNGSNLGVLIGPKGATVGAIQELTRTAVQRHISGHHSRLLVDVAGYRQKRREALERFTREVA